MWNIVWHWRDLRVEDNPALVAAAKSGKIVPLYIHCPEDEEKWAIGSASKWWLHHSLESLAEQYRGLGTRLLIRSGPAEKVLQQLAKEIEIGEIFWNQRYEPALRPRDKRIALDYPVERFEGNYLITPTKIMNQAGEPYRVYTPFSRAVFADQSWRKPLGVPKVEGGHRLKSDALDLLPDRDWADHFPDRWTPGRKGALAQLRSFKKKANHYSKRRDYPGEYSTSRLSPHLHFGEISPHEVWEAIETEGFRKQLIWREFGNYFLFHFPAATDRNWKEEFNAFPWSKSKGALEAWQRGLTGYPIVDAGMRELWETGWMHNRVRMIAASFLIKDLMIHWREGARWFWDTLVDADLANNSMGWQWVAGSGPDAAPYFRIFNPALQGEKFDPKGDYIRRWVPELAELPDKVLHTPWKSDLDLDYPAPIVDHKEARERALAAYKTCH